MQASLFERIDSEVQAKQNLLKQQLKRRDNRHIAKRNRKDGYDQYNPRLLKRLLLETIGSEWVGFTVLARAIKISPLGIDHMLSKLIRWGYLEETELYYHKESSALFEVNRLERPVGYYRGFEFGYRRLTTTSE